MNEIINTTPVGEIDIPVHENFYIDAEGNRVEIPWDDGEINAFGSATALDEAERGGEAASEETTVYVAADDADHPVTVQ